MIRVNFILFYFILFNHELSSEMQTYVELIVQSNVEKYCVPGMHIRVRACVIVFVYVRSYVCACGYVYVRM